MAHRLERQSLSDTSPEAQQVLDALFRGMSSQEKWERLRGAQRTARTLSEAGYRANHPHANAGEVQRHWIVSRTGLAISQIGEQPAMTRADDDVQVLREVVEALDRLAIPYALGGSMASSVYGVMRYTQDADLTVEPFPGREQALADCFGGEHYVSVGAMRQANQQHSSFNIIHTTVGFKVDLFVRKDSAFERSAMSRRKALTFPDRPQQPIDVLAAEDVVLFKLQWYRAGGEMSERQWLDVVNVLKAQRDRLDRAYLDRWGADLGVDDLLRRSLAEAGY
jgi:hypothetical protein